MSPLERAEDQRMLSSVPFLRRVPGDAMARLMVETEIRNFRTGDPVVRQGLPSQGFHVVLSGRIGAFRETSESHRAMLCLFEPGDPCCLVAPLDGGPNSCTLTAIEPARLAFVPRRVLQETLLLYPSTGADFIEFLCRCSRTLCARATRMGKLSVSARLADYLIEQAGERWRETPGKPVEIHMKRAELAEHLGTVREVVTRALMDFARRGIVEVRGRRVFILAPDELLRVSGREPHGVAAAAKTEGA